MDEKERVPERESGKSAGSTPLERQAGFHVLFRELESDVQRACRKQAEWPGKIAGGIGAALDFAARRPAAAEALTTEGGAFRADSEGVRHPELIERFSEMLAEAAPPERRLPAATNEALISTIVTVVVVHIKCETTDRLPEATPDLIHLTLLPYAGFAEAQRWVGRPGPPPDGDE